MRFLSHRPAKPHWKTHWFLNYYKEKPYISLAYRSSGYLFEKQIPALAFLQSKNISTLQSNRISKFFIFSSFHISGAPVSGTLGRIKDSPQDITVRSCSHSFPSPSINRSITSFSGLIVGVGDGDGDGVTEGVGVEDGIGVTEGVGVSVSAGVPSDVEVTVGVGDSSDAITSPNQKLPAKYFLHQLCMNLLPLN